MAAALRSIGQVLAILKTEFSDVSISKIRFLESEGLVSPERAPSGYRKYADSDVERLRYILTMQRDHYLPLKVIKENLDLMDQGVEPPAVESPPAPTQLAQAPARQAEPPAAPRPPGDRAAKRPIAMNRRQILEACGLSEATFIELERQRIIQPRRATGYYGREALTIALATKKLEAYGFDTRHLRAIKQSAEREAGLVEQAIQPYLRRREGASEAAQEVTQWVVHIHAALIHTLLER